MASQDALVSRDTAWFGMIEPPPESRLYNGELDVRAADLARGDFEEMMSGFVRQHTDLRVRPFGIVACSDANDAPRAAKHLVDDVEVPAILGLGDTAEFLKLSTEILLPKKVMAIATISPSPLITSVPQLPGEPRLVWRFSYNAADSVNALAVLVSDFLEPQARAAGTLARSEPYRVAYLRPQIPALSAFDGRLVEFLRFNQKSVVENGDNYRQIIVEPSRAAPDAASLQKAVQEVLAFRPNVVINLANIEPLYEIESQWPRDTAFPTYLSLGIAANAFEWMGNSSDRRRRFLSVWPLSSRPENARFVLHYNEKSLEKVALADAPNTAYDAFYFLAYATYALGDEPVTGVSLSRAMSRLLPPGRRVEVGPASIFDGFSALRRGESIDLTGAFGSFDFDVATGEAPFDFAIVCAAPGADGTARDAIESGLVYMRATGKIEGAMHCP